MATDKVTAEEYAVIEQAVLECLTLDDAERAYVRRDVRGFPGDIPGEVWQEAAVRLVRMASR